MLGNSRAATAGSSVCTFHADLRRAHKRAWAAYRSLPAAVSAVRPAITLLFRAWGGLTCSCDCLKVGFHGAQRAPWKPTVQVVYGELRALGQVQVSVR